MIAIRNSALRTTLIAAAALVGTAAGFGATTAPVHAAEAYYKVTLAKPVDGTKTAVLGAAAWSCSGDSCTAGRDTSSPVVTCERVAKEFGQVATFATPKGELDAKKLERCNSKA